MAGRTGKILVIKPSSLGDIVHLFPALELLRRAYPDSELDFVIHPAFAGLLDFSPFPVRKKILFNRKKLGSPISFLPEFFRLCREIRKENYELVLDFQGLFRSGILAGVSKSCITAGFAEPREKSAAWFYNRKLPVVMEQHAVSRYAELVNKLCGTAFPVPQVQIPEGTEKLPELPRPYVVLVPGARWESKKFPPRLFGEIVLKIRETVPGCAAVVAGAACDNAAAAAIAEIVPDAVDLTGKTSLAQLFPLMDNAAAVITNDSGPMHIAAMTGSRVFALFGPTRAGLTGPWGESHKILRNEGLHCLECMKRNCPETPACTCHGIDTDAAGSEIGLFIKQKIS